MNNLIMNTFIINFLYNIYANSLFTLSYNNHYMII